MDQTCDGMHMLSRDEGCSGPNLGPSCNILLIKKVTTRNFQSAKILLEVMNAHVMDLFGLDPETIVTIVILAFLILVRRSIQFVK